MEEKKGFSKTKIIAGTAVFAALSFIVSFFEFSIFPGVPFLKLDFSSVFALLAGFIYGPFCGVAVCAVKETLCIIKSSTGGVGELANFLVTVSFISVPAITYRYKKGFKVVVYTLIVGCLIQNGVALLANRFINFPLYLGSEAKEFFVSVWYYVWAFNAVKATSVSLITVMLYKRVSRFIKKI